MGNMAKRYLGDGAFVEHDGYQLVLTAENGREVTDTVALEPAAWAELLRFVDDLKQQDVTVTTAKGGG